MLFDPEHFGVFNMAVYGESRFGGSLKWPLKKLQFLPLVCQPNFSALEVAAWFWLKLNSALHLLRSTEIYPPSFTTDKNVTDTYRDFLNH